MGEIEAQTLAAKDDVFLLKEDLANVRSRVVKINLFSGFSAVFGYRGFRVVDREFHVKVSC